MISPDNFTAWIPTILLVIGGIIVILQNRSTNRMSRSSDVIQTLQIRVKQLEDANKIQFETFTKQIADLNLETGKCQGVIQEKNAMIDKLEKIISNRNPELITLLEEIKNFMKNLHDKVANIDSRTETAQKRNEIVDNGHVDAVKK